MKKLLLFPLTFFILLNMPTKAQWQQSQGSAGVNVYGIVINGSVVIAGMGNGILKSTDNGATFTLSNNGLTSTNVRAIATIGSYTFAGTYWGGGVFLSTDYGSTWTAVNTGMTNKWIFSLLAKNTDLFAGTSTGGVFSTGDYGSNWVPATNGITAQYIYALTRHNMKIFAGTEDGIFQSSDNGLSWFASNNGMTANSTVAAIAVNGSYIYAGTYENGVFLSTDDGSTWTAINNGLTTTDIRSLTVNGNAVYAGTYGGGIYISTNAGSSWTPINTGLSNMNVYSLYNDGSTMFAGTGDGIFKRSIGEINSINDISNTVAIQLSAYPNPFKSQATIQYSVPATENVIVKIYDVLGNCVLTMVDRTLSQGTYQETLNGESLSSGLYYCTLQTGDIKKTIKLILNK